MFKRIRQLNISLAAKCQLLFGAAVVLIIGAALLVPWQRMEQLTEQLNERSARTLIDYAVDSHAAKPQAAESEATLAPTTRPAVRVYPTSNPVTDSEGSVPPRFILAGPNRDESALTPFERRSIRRLTERRDRDSYEQSYDAEDGTRRYRLARLDTGCVKCHAAEAIADPAGPTTAPVKAKLIGIVAVDIPSQVETSQLLLNRVFLLTAGLLAGTLAIVVFYLITTRLILQPVRVLQETAEKVSQGDLNIRSDISTGDEFQQLSETFNTMLANLKESSDQLRAANKNLDVKLVQLAESNVALYEANRLKSEFLANVSHELRTPLNSILGFADLLKDSSTSVGDPKATHYIQNILASGKNLLDLITDLLDLAKIEAGRMEIRSEPLSITDLFEGLTSVLKPLSEQKQLQVNAVVSPDVPIIYTDRAKLQQVLYNFLSNAIKFSPAGERIDVSAEREGEESIRIAVIDRGPGIPADKHEVIFEKFRQVDSSHTREHSGTGLGLAISRELVMLLGGTIGVKSELEQGSTFWVVLPLKNVAGTQDVRERLVMT